MIRLIMLLMITLAAAPEIAVNSVHVRAITVTAIRGQVAWRIFAANPGAVAVPVLPASLLAGLAAGVVVAANVLSISPALLAAREAAAAPSSVGSHVGSSV